MKTTPDGRRWVTLETTAFLHGCDPTKLENRIMFGSTSHLYDRRERLVHPILFELLTGKEVR